MTERPSLDDYVDVATRIADFRATYPEGTLAPLNPAQPYELRQVEGWDRDGNRVEQTFVVYAAAAYRTPGDPRPGVGVAWEVFPGRTPYTRGSELQNAETSAWGRAIIAVGASDSKRGIASREEVRNRQAERDDQPAEWRAPANPSSRKADRQRAGRDAPADDPWATAPATAGGPEDQPGTSVPAQHQALGIAFTRAGISGRADRLAYACSVLNLGELATSKDLSYAGADRLIKRLAADAAGKDA